MQGWIRKNWRGLLLNGAALAIMVTLLIQYEPYGGELFRDPVFEHSGKWAIRFLIFSLAMTPLNIVFKWRWPLRLRKPAGLWAFGFAALHYCAYTSFRLLTVPWYHKAYGPYVVPGLAALLILIVMAATSHRWAMRWLGKWWKRLHRLVYLVGLLVMLHAIWAFTMSKKALTQPNHIYEFLIYAIIVIMLLLVRIPTIRRWLRRRPINTSLRDFVVE